MGVVKSQESNAVRVVQSERIAQAVRALGRLRDAPDLELRKTTVFIPMNTAIEIQEEFEGVLS